jgi:hypothetical protein
MARNRSFDFDDEDDFAAASPTAAHASGTEFSESGSAGPSGMGDALIGEALLGEAGMSQQSGQHSSRRSAQPAPTATRTRSAKGQKQSETSTSMQEKRGNQPR